jgi:branched-chain amino acid transport system substrate-binding protein
LVSFKVGFQNTAKNQSLKIAHIYSKTGPLEAYGKQTQTGLMMGLDYATGGTMRWPARRSW